MDSLECTDHLENLKQEADDLGEEIQTKKVRLCGVEEVLTHAEAVRDAVQSERDSLRGDIDSGLARLKEIAGELDDQNEAWNREVTDLGNDFDEAMDEARDAIGEAESQAEDDE